MNLFKPLNLYLLALLAVTSTAAAQPVMYVDVANSTPGNGNSWGTCNNDLSSAIQTAFAAGTYTEIRVAKGTYKPDTTGLGDPRTATFFLLSDVSIKGGYPGYNTGSPDARDVVANPTSLSGNIQTGATTDNCYHVVTAKDPSGGSVNTNAVLDGFTIRDGYGDTSVDGGNGAGIYVPAGSKPQITNCTVTTNFAPDSGGGILINGVSTDDSDVRITNTAVVDNEADVIGGGMYCVDASPNVFDSSFNENISGYLGGGVGLDGTGSAKFTRCTFDSNLIPDGEGGGGVYTSANGLVDPEADPPINNPGPIFRECSISENTAIAGAGGGTYADHSDVSFVRCRIASNTLTNPDVSDLNGGGLYFGGGSGRVI